MKYIMGMKFSEAIDILDSTFEYEETDKKVEVMS